MSNSTASNKNDISTHEFTPEYDVKYWTRGKGFLEFNYRIYQATIGPWVRKTFNYKSNTFKPKSKTFLALVNHTNDIDPFFLAVMFPHYIRFVSAESILRKPVSGPIITFLQRPIGRKKGSSGALASYYIRENLKNGISVAMFPEGVRSINGKTGYISPKTAELLKDTGAGLITCRIYGGYLCNPLWAKYSRKGKVWGEMVHEYTSDELSEMSLEEINAAIVNDLSVNAYDIQREKMIPYPGKDLAEGLENVVYLCPKCLSLDGLESSGDTYNCKCGLKLSLDEFGFFKGDEVPFENVCEWETWQRARLGEYAEQWKSEKGKEICSQKDVYLTRLEDTETEVVISDADMTLFSDELVFESETGCVRYPLSDISEISNFRSTALILSIGGARFEVRHGQSWPVFKFIALIRFLIGKKYL